MMFFAMFMDLPEVLIASVILPMLIVIPLWRILTRLGFPGLLAMLALIPIVNLILLWFLAFADWPVIDARKRRRPSHPSTARAS